MNSNEYKQYIEIIMITELENSFLYFCQTDNQENYFKNALIYLCKNESNGLIGAKDCFHNTYFQNTYMIYNK